MSATPSSVVTLPTPAAGTLAGISDRNTLSIINPRFAGSYITDGTSKPTALIQHDITTNLLIENEDVLIVYSPHEANQIMGRVFSFRQYDSRWRYSTCLKRSYDMSAYSQARVVSSLLTAFSDTVSVTSTTLSGRLTSISMFDIPVQVPAYSDFPSYQNQVPLKLVNGPLADGVAIKSYPFFSDFEETYNPSGRDNEPLSTPAFSITGDVSVPPTQGAAVEINTASYPLLLSPFLSGDIRIKLTLRLTSTLSAPFIGPAYFLGQTTCYDAVNGQTDLYDRRPTFATAVEGAQDNDVVAYGTLVFDPDTYGNVDQVMFSVPFYNSPTATTWSYRLEFFPIDPIMSGDRYDRNVTYIQGSSGAKTINIQGKINLQAIPKAANNAVIPTSLNPISSFYPLEAAKLLLSNYETSGYLIVDSMRREAANMSRLDTMTTYEVLATSASNSLGFSSTIGGNSILGLLGKGIGLLSKVGLNPFQLLHGLIDKGEKKVMGSSAIPLSGQSAVPMGFAAVPMGYSTTQLNSTGQNGLFDIIGKVLGFSAVPDTDSFLRSRQMAPTGPIATFNKATVQDPIFDAEPRISRNAVAPSNGPLVISDDTGKFESCTPEGPTPTFLRSSLFRTSTVTPSLRARPGTLDISSSAKPTEHHGSPSQVRELMLNAYASRADSVKRVGKNSAPTQPPLVIDDDQDGLLDQLGAPMNDLQQDPAVTNNGYHTWLRNSIRFSKYPVHTPTFSSTANACRMGIFSTYMGDRTGGIMGDAVLMRVFVSLGPLKREDAYTRIVPRTTRATNLLPSNIHMFFDRTLILTKPQDGVDDIKTSMDTLISYLFMHSKLTSELHARGLHLYWTFTAPGGVDKLTTGTSCAGAMINALYGNNPFRFVEMGLKNVELRNAQGVVTRSWYQPCAVEFLYSKWPAYKRDFPALLTEASLDSAAVPTSGALLMLSEASEVVGFYQACQPSSFALADECHLSDQFAAEVIFTFSGVTIRDLNMSTPQYKAFLRAAGEMILEPVAKVVPPQGIKPKPQPAALDSVSEGLLVRKLQEYDAELNETISDHISKYPNVSTDHMSEDFEQLSADIVAAAGGELQPAVLNELKAFVRSNSKTRGLWARLNALEQLMLKLDPNHVVRKWEQLPVPKTRLKGKGRKGRGMLALDDNDVDFIQPKKKSEPPAASSSRLTSGQLPAFQTARVQVKPGAERANLAEEDTAYDEF